MRLVGLDTLFGPYNRSPTPTKDGSELETVNSNDAKNEEVYDEVCVSSILQL